jgi:nitrogenase subunit NifH
LYIFHPFSSFIRKLRPKLIHKIVPRDASVLAADAEGENVANNFVDVAVNRVFDDLVDEMLSSVTADVANSVKYNCDGDVAMLAKVGVESTVDMLQRETAGFVAEFADADVVQGPI